MLYSEQGTTGNTRYTVVPRTLSFILSGDALLLLRGAPAKRLWANRLNGLGGHLEPGEDPHAGALREIREESGLEPADLALSAVLHIAGQSGHPGVLLFVYLGHVIGKETLAGDEGTLEWYPLGALPWAEMVSDLSELLPRLLQAPDQAMLYGVYDTAPDGSMSFRWSDTDNAIER